MSNPRTNKRNRVGRRHRLILLTLSAMAGACNLAPLSLPGLNSAPTANAGPDLEARVGERVSLSGIGSQDPDGDSLGYQWRKTSGPSAVVQNELHAEANFTPAAEGVYVFSLTVTDSIGSSDQDDIRVIVSADAAPFEPCVPPNDKDTDGDGLMDCLDGCPNDAQKQEPGACGCGQVDRDGDGDGTADCVDGCPSDPLKTSPGSCGCGIAEGDCGTSGPPDCETCPFTPIVSNFDGGDDGWRLDGGSFSAPTAPSWSEEGFVYAIDARWAYWIAPAAIRGNMLGAYGRAIAFDAGWDDHCCSGNPRVILAGNGLTLNFSPAYDPALSGAAYWIRLEETEAWRDAASNRRATAAQIKQVLSGVTQLKLLTGSSGESWIDNFVFGAATPTPSSAPVTSDFAAGDEGWRLTGGAFHLRTKPSFDATNGFLFASHAAWASWIAPADFRGNFLSLLGKRLTYDAAWDDRCCSGSPRIVLYGGGYEIHFMPSADPDQTFSNIGVKLDATANWFTTGVGRTTDNQMRAVLQNLQMIKILTGSSGISSLENVVLGAE